MIYLEEYPTLELLETDDFMGYDFEIFEDPASNSLIGMISKSRTGSSRPLAAYAFYYDREAIFYIAKERVEAWLNGAKAMLEALNK